MMEEGGFMMSTGLRHDFFNLRGGCLEMQYRDHVS